MATRRKSSSTKPKTSTKPEHTKPTTRTDGAERLENDGDPLAGDMHAHLRGNPAGAVDHYRDDEGAGDA